MSSVATAACGASGGAAGAAAQAALQFFAAAQCLAGGWPPQADVPDGSSFDFIVVGGGTAGAAVAARLAELDATVLLLEAGGDPPADSVVPGFRGALKGSAYDWNFTTVNDGASSQALHGGSQRQPRGRLLGGSGSINDMVYARGFPADYDEWAEALGPDWSWDAVLPYFIKSEHLTDEKIINDPELMKYHGRGGAVEVAGLNDTTHTTAVFLEAFKELGFKMVKDMTYPHEIGAGRFSHTIRGGRRDSSLTGLLSPVANQLNLFVLKDTLVTKILIENKRAVGIKAIYHNETLQLYAKKEIIISTGTFNTPKLLMLSGVGPKGHLSAMGIEVVQELPVGGNLHDHVMVLAYLAAANGSCPADAARAHLDLVHYLYDQSGPYSRSDSMGAYLSLSQTSNKSVPDFAIYPTCIPIGSNFYFGCSTILGFKEEICQQLEDINRNKELLSLAVVLLKPKSRGKVRLQSTDPLAPPLIYSGTFSNSEDLEDFPEAIRMALSIAETSHFKNLGAEFVSLHIEGCEGGAGDEREEAWLRCYARALATSAWHAAGSAAAGVVLDARLRVRGVAALRVADASALPAAPRANTNAPVLMLAERAAVFIKEYHGYDHTN